MSSDLASVGIEPCTLTSLAPTLWRTAVAEKLPQASPSSLDSVERTLESHRYSSGEPRFKSGHGPHNSCEWGNYYCSPIAGGDRGQSGWRFCLKPDLKQKMKTQGSQPVPLHLDTMKGDCQEFACLPLGRTGSTTEDWSRYQKYKAYRSSLGQI